MNALSNAQNVFKSSSQKDIFRLMSLPIPVKNRSYVAYQDATKDIPERVGLKFTCDFTQGRDHSYVLSKTARRPSEKKVT